MAQKQTKYTNIIWDFNGTLLNDVDESIATMNELLSRRKLPTLTKKRYQEVFDFPVYDYYKTLGFDFSKEDWAEVGTEYMDAYHQKEQDFTLFPDVENILCSLQSLGVKHYILSAMKQESILNLLKRFNIEHYFDGVYGLDNHYADGKIERGRQLLQIENIRADNSLMIGDTCHDADVAQSIGIKSVLISNGHHSYERLSATANPTFTSLSKWLNKF